MKNPQAEIQRVTEVGEVVEIRAS